MSTLQFNLLPDIKLEYLKTQRMRNKLVSISFLAGAVAVVIFLMMLATVHVAQKKQLDDAQKQVNNASSELQKINGLSQLLTVENQLKSLVSLHQSKHISSRIFGYLPVITPTNVSIGRVSLDLKSNTMTIDGTTDSQRSVNTFVDTLKFTTYTTETGSTEKQAFPTVIESSFGLTPNSASYTLNVTFDPILFSNSVTDSNGKPITPSLKVPNLTTTRSVINDPSNLLFNGQFNSPQKDQTGR